MNFSFGEQIISKGKLIKSGGKVKRFWKCGDGDLRLEIRAL